VLCGLEEGFWIESGNRLWPLYGPGEGRREYASAMRLGISKWIRWQVK
jgi:hypothetical protein